MAVINFSIPNTLEGQIKTVVKSRGFSSKAEFFRFTVIKYLDEIRSGLDGKTENGYTIKKEIEMLADTEDAIKYGKRYDSIEEAHKDISRSRS